MSWPAMESGSLVEESSAVQVQRRIKVRGGVAGGDDAMVHLLTPDESWENFDQAAQRYLGMSGEAFIAAWDAGQFDDDPDRPALVRVSLLRPVGR